MEWSARVTVKYDVYEWKNPNLNVCKWCLRQTLIRRLVFYNAKIHSLVTKARAILEIQVRNRESFIFLANFT